MKLTEYSIDRRKIKEENRKLNKWRHRKKIKATGYRTQREELKNRDMESDRGRYRKNF